MILYEHHGNDDGDHENGGDDSLGRVKVCRGESARARGVCLHRVAQIIICIECVGIDGCVISWRWVDGASGRYAGVFGDIGRSISWVDEARDGGEGTVAVRKDGGDGVCRSWCDEIITSEVDGSRLIFGL